LSTAISEPACKYSAPAYRSSTLASVSECQNLCSESMGRSRDQIRPSSNPSSTARAICVNNDWAMLWKRDPFEILRCNSTPTAKTAKTSPSADSTDKAIRTGARASTCCNTGNTIVLLVQPKTD